ncbi:MAG: hypothetical protein AAGH41_09675 [Pseudomonadota bacterium]
MNWLQEAWSAFESSDRSEDREQREHREQIAKAKTKERLMVFPDNTAPVPGESDREHEARGPGTATAQQTCGFQRSVPAVPDQNQHHRDPSSTPRALAALNKILVAKGLPPTEGKLSKEAWASSVSTLAPSDIDFVCYPSASTRGETPGSSVTRLFWRTLSDYSAVGRRIGLPFGDVLRAVLLAFPKHIPLVDIRSGLVLDGLKAKERAHQQQDGATT